MKWSETIASRCRYGDVAGRIFGEGDVIWEHSEDDWQGYANVLVAMPDGSFIHYEWTYGSCSGCDEWEGDGLDDDAVEATMRNAMAVLPSVEVARRYFKLEDEYEHAKVPTANSATNGSIPGMLRYLSNDIGKDFQDMGEAFAAWVAEQKP